MEILANNERTLCWKAGYRANLSVRFGGRWAETCRSNVVTRRPSTLCHPLAGSRCSLAGHSGLSGTRLDRNNRDLPAPDQESRRPGD